MIVLPAAGVLIGRVICCTKVSRQQPVHQWFATGKTATSYANAALDGHYDEVFRAMP